MIKPIPFIFLILMVIIGFTGCKQSITVIQPIIVSQTPSPPAISYTSTSTQTFANFPTVTFFIKNITPTSTIKPPSTSTISPTPLDTLESAKVDEMILALLQNPDKCIAPCFWGIVPGITTFNEANQFFTHLGILPYRSTIDGKEVIYYEWLD